MKRKTCMLVLLLLGLCFSLNLFANSEKDNLQKKKYGTTKFVWTENYVTEGSNCAMAPSSEEIVTTCLSKDGKPLRWVRKNDIYKFGKYTGASTFETALYNMSIDE